MHKSPERWKSKFGRFVERIGTASLAGQLEVDTSAVYHWLSGRTAPDPLRALAIHELARESGFALSFEEIYVKHRTSPRARRKARQC